VPIIEGVDEESYGSGVSLLKAHSVTKKRDRFPTDQPLAHNLIFGSKLVANSADFAGLADYSGS
jgi:hypothetical protein